MAAKDKAAKAGKAARNNPYVQRIASDAELRDNLRAAYDAARNAYGRLSNGRAPTKALMDDKKLHRDLKEAASSLREATHSLREGPKRARRRGRKLGIVVVGAGLALALNEGARTKVLDALFGKEEEFDYTSATSPAPAPEKVNA